jgi:tRNA dimethylallyltransferase
MDKVLVICGPTAVGKTALAVKLAKQFNGQLLSVDSRQVYRGLDIGTGKDVGQTVFKSVFKKRAYNFGFYRLDGVKLWGCDLVEPDYSFSAVDFHFCANRLIEKIISQGKLPILVGGSGFYLKVLFNGLTVTAPPNWPLRRRLSNLSLSRLQFKLKSLDLAKFNQFNQSDINNSRRLIRAIEMASNKKKTIGSTSRFKGLKVDSLWLGLKKDRPALYRQIDARVKKRLDQGLVSEIENLLSRGYDWHNSVLGTTLAYRQWRDFFEQKKTLPQTVAEWSAAEHKFARRQMTWFKKQKQINWFDTDQPLWSKNLLNFFKKWYDR